MRSERRRQCSRSHRPWWICAAAPLLVAAAVAVAQPAARINRLIEALERDEPAISGEVWTFIDQEHGPYVIDRLGTRLEELAEARNQRGQQILAPIVRIPAEGDQSLRWIVKQVLERGAMGIIVPQVDTARQAERIVQAARFPQHRESRFPAPVGRRGFAGAPRTWGLSVLDYVRVADAWPLNPDGELFVMPMIESIEGVRNVDEILAVGGVGGVLVGPNDLSMGLGVGPWRADGQAFLPAEAEAAIQEVARACVKSGKHCGMVTWNEAETEKYLEAGYRVIFAVYPRSAEGR